MLSGLRCSVNGHVVSSVSNDYSAFIRGQAVQHSTCPATVSHIGSPPSSTAPLRGPQNLALYYYVHSILLPTLQRLITLILLRNFNVMSVCLPAVHMCSCITPAQHCSTNHITLYTYNTQNMMHQSKPYYRCYVSIRTCFILYTGQFFFIVAPCILIYIYIEFTHQQMHFYQFKKHIKI